MELLPGLGGERPFRILLFLGLTYSCPAGRKPAVTPDLLELFMGHAKRMCSGRRGKRPRVLGPTGGLCFVKEGVWEANVQRVREWGVVYVGHFWRPSLSRVFVQPWDVWECLSHSDRRTLLMSFLKRPQQEVAGSSGGQPRDPEFQSQYPALFEYLTATQFPDGASRRTSSLTIFAEEGSFKACLNEREGGYALFVTEGRFLAVIEALELLLQEENPPWRKSRPPGRPKGQGGKGSA